MAELYFLVIYIFSNTGMEKNASALLIPYLFGEDAEKLFTMKVTIWN